MNQVQAVIFDFDGVLVDSEPVRFWAGAQALAEIGVSLSWERFVQFWLGRTDEAGLRDLLGRRFEAEGARVAARRNALYEERLDEVTAFVDTVRFLRRVPDGIRLAVATGSRRMEVDRILKRHGMATHFHAVVTAEDYARAKPAPDPFLAAARRLGLPPDSCLVVEDSPAGVAAAHAAGMPVVAVDRGRGAIGLDAATGTVTSLEELTLTPQGEVVFGAIPAERERPASESQFPPGFCADAQNHNQGGAMDNAIGRVTSILSVPYGYTVSLWSAGALTITRLGPPSVLDVLLFVIGAVAAFVTLAGVGRNHLDAEVPMQVPSLVVLNLFPIVAAIAVITLPTGVMGRSVGYLANSFLATAAYVLSLAALIRATRVFRRRATALQAARRE